MCQKNNIILGNLALKHTSKVVLGLQIKLMEEQQEDKLMAYKKYQVQVIYWRSINYFPLHNISMNCSYVFTYQLKGQGWQLPNGQWS